MTVKEIWTVGHSNRSSEEFMTLLSSCDIRSLADVRRFPGSRRQPQFGQERLQRALQSAGIGYRHFPLLGGRRSERKIGSPNGGWRVESFNAYADYMLTEQFCAAIDSLQEAALCERTVMMCAEALPWRCHRRLIADALLVRGWTVWNMFTAGRLQKHSLTEFAVVDDLRVHYPASENQAG